MMLSGKRVLVIGLGRSGAAAAKLLCAQKASVTAIDAKDESALKTDLNELRRLGIAIFTNDNSLKRVHNQELVVVSPGIPLEHPLLTEAQRLGIPVISELELASQFCSNPIIAVTGTNGKSTTTALISHILNSAGVPSLPVGNIGTAFASVVPAPDKTLVVEVSSYQLETITTFKPHIAVWINLTADHLGRHGNLDNYASIKAHLFKNQTPENYLVYNLDDRYVKKFAQTASSQLFPFTFNDRTGAYIQQNKIMLNWKDIKGEVIPIDRLRIRGRHNLENALSATAASIAFGLTPEAVAGGLESFTGIEHRQEVVAVHNGITFVNDSKATNLDSTLKALETLNAPLILIAGGRGKGESYSPAGDLIRQKVKLLITLGETAEQITRELSSTTDTMYAHNLEEAVKIAFKHALPGDTILLSPMCASFDMFDDFEHRGRVFKSVVREIIDASI